MDPLAGFRRAAKLPAQAMKTYRIASPSDQQIVATCAQVGCPSWRNGWDTIVPDDSPQAAYIRSGRSGRSYREMARGDGLAVFRFEPYQRCFADHRTRPEVYAVVGGDVRGNPHRIPARIHARPGDWVEDSALHQQALADRLAQG